MKRRRPSGYLLLLLRTFDSEPLGFFADRGEAEARARDLLAGYDPDAPAEGAPEVGHGCLGPPGLVSRVSGIALIPFVAGEPVREGRAHFIPAAAPDGGHA